MWASKSAAPVYDELDVTRFGARGDYTGTPGQGTDNLAAFNAAFDAAVALSASTGRGVKLIIPPGRYRFTDEWNIYRANSPRRDIVIQGADQLVTKLVADFFGAGKKLVKCVDPLGISRSSPTSLRHLGFENARTSGGVNPVFVSILGHGESRLEGLRFAGTNNSFMQLYGEQNLRATDIVAFNCGRNFNYKNTAGFTFSVDTGTKTITASAAIFDAGDVGKYFFMYPSDTSRRIRYQIASFISSTQVTYANDDGLAEVNQPGHFEPARCSMTAGSAVLTANADVFTADDVGLVLYVRRARAGAFGDAILRGEITGYTDARTVTLSVAADNTITDEFFALAALDMGQYPGQAGSSDVKIDKLHIESFRGLAFIAQNTDSYRIISSKLHGVVTTTDANKSLACAWLDDYGGYFNLELDSTASLSDARIYCCNFNDWTIFDATASRSIRQGTIFKSELFTDPGGYLEVRGLNSYVSSGTGIVDANKAANPDDPRIILTGLVNTLGDSQKARLYVGSDAYFEPNGRFRSHKYGADDYLPTVPAWTGTTAPSGASANRYRWEQLGSLVYFVIRLEYVTAGVDITSLRVPLPADMPAPELMYSNDGATDVIGAMVRGFIGSDPAALPSLCRSWMQANGAGGYELAVMLNSGSIAARFGIIAGYYFTA